MLPLSFILKDFYKGWVYLIVTHSCLNSEGGVMWRSWGVAVGCADFYDEIIGKLGVQSQQKSAWSDASFQVLHGMIFISKRSIVGSIIFATSSNSLKMTVNNAIS